MFMSFYSSFSRIYYPNKIMYPSVFDSVLAIFKLAFLICRWFTNLLICWFTPSKSGVKCRTYLNKGAGLFKYIWPFSLHLTLKGDYLEELNLISNLQLRCNMNPLNTRPNMKVRKMLMWWFGRFMNVLFTFKLCFHWRRTAAWRYGVCSTKMHPD